MASRTTLRSFFFFIVVVALSGAAAIAITLVLSRCEKPTVTKTSIGLESQAGKLVRRSMLSDARIVRERVIQEAVDLILGRLRATMDADPYEAEIVVIDSGIPNAFSMPGGFIAVDASLIAITENPEELAAVLAHELSHMVHADAWKSLQASLGASLVLSAMGGDDAARIVRELVSQATFLSFSREVETRADADALRILARAGIPPESFGTALERLKAASEGMPELPEILSSHPDIEARIKIARDAAAASPRGSERLFALDWKSVKKALPSAFSP